MPDHQDQGLSSDAMRINITDFYEVEYWTYLFGCTDAELCAAVKKVGVMSDQVAGYLAIRRLE